MILDPDAKVLRWISNLYKDHVVRLVQQGDDDEEVVTLKKWWAREFKLYCNLVYLSFTFEDYITE